MVDRILKVIIFFILVNFTKPLMAISAYCNFEEVYQNKETQNGKLLINEEYFRYEYESLELYTIIKNPRGVFTVSNLDNNHIRRVGDNQIINHLVNIYQKYPNIDNYYKRDEFVFLIEKSKINNFIKRISIQSNQLNLSIFFYDCEFKEIQKFYFNEESLIDYS